MHALLIVGIVLLVFALFRHRAHRHFGYAHCGGRRHHRHRRHRRHHSIVELLDLTPDQERELRTVMDGLHDAFDPLREEVGQSRSDLASALRADTFEDGLLDDMYDRHEKRLAVLRVDWTAALGRVHEMLDPRQRERLADLLAKGRGPWRGPYR